jgi:Fe-S-cluster containining protein
MAPRIETPLFLGKHLVPGVWRRLLPAGREGMRFPDESRSSCGACPRVESDGYRPDYRCCTYFPRIPNYLLGFALLDPASRVHVESAAVAPFLMPEGFQASPQQWANFLTEAGEDRYGKSDLVLCPFLQRENGFCGIYKYRNAVCSTYFCYHDDGRQGVRFWSHLQTYMVQVEMALDQWCLEQLGFDVPAYIERLAGLVPQMDEVSRKKDAAWSAMARRAAWGDWYGRELEIYRACAQLVKKHESELLALVEAQKIREADAFEIAATKLVPQKHRGEIEDDYDPDRVPYKPSRLWKAVEKAQAKLK